MLSHVHMIVAHVRLCTDSYEGKYVVLYGNIYKVFRYINYAFLCVCLLQRTVK